MIRYRALLWKNRSPSRRLDQVGTTFLAFFALACLKLLKLFCEECYVLRLGFS